MLFDATVAFLSLKLHWTYVACSLISLLASD